MSLPAKPEHIHIDIRYILLISIVAHALFIFLKFDYNLISKSKPLHAYQQVKVIDIKDYEAVRKRFRKKLLESAKVKSLPKQIVNSDQTGFDQKDDTSRFLGKKTQSFGRQTIAKKISSYKKAGIGSMTKATGKKKTSLKDLSLSKLGTIAAGSVEVEDKNLKKVGLQNGDKNSKGLAASNDFIEDIPLGDVTRLNTVEFKYFGFYERIRKRLEQHWGQSLAKKAKSLRSRGRSIASNENFITSLIIQLDKSGHITRVQVIDGSGMNEFDEAAVESFNQAGPFPNPPKGMIKNGVAEIKWSFVVKS